MYHIRLNTYMTRLLLTLISIFTFTFSSFANEVDFTKDGHYHKLAEDFKMYSVCQAIHQNLGMFIVINYGVGANLKFPEKWKEQQNRPDRCCSESRRRRRGAARRSNGRNGARNTA